MDVKGHSVLPPAPSTLDFVASVVLEVELKPVIIALREAAKSAAKVPLIILTLVELQMKPLQYGSCRRPGYQHCGFDEGVLPAAGGVAEQPPKHSLISWMVGDCSSEMLRSRREC